MREYLKFFIDGQWADPLELKVLDVENPATEETCGRIALGGPADVDRAVSAARRAFPTWSRSSRQERLELLQAIKVEYQKRYADIAAAITEEMGAPVALATSSQAGLGLAHLDAAINALQSFEFEKMQGTTLIRQEAIGVCALITPWNWPINQVAVKVYPALATGCTMVLKPSEIAPFSAQIFAEVLEAAGVPAGVFNLVQGDGPGVGAALSGHPDVDMVSFTGSTRAGIAIAQNAAASVKRVSQELGGKSANILLDDEQLAAGVARGVATMMMNSGQSCNAPTRMLVPASRKDEAIAAARTAAEGITVGDPTGNFTLGPVVSRAQFDKIQGYVQSGIDDGATLVAGGPGRPDGLGKGHYVKPTIFADVTQGMTVAREEIFGPVLVILSYQDIAEAIAIANDTEYGLAGYVNGADVKLCGEIAKEIRAGLVAINGAFDVNAPFGGYKLSGNGREWGAYGFHDYLEIKSIPGFAV
ncbi:aldehyde dehydrogenase family protein [Novosphingobium malaysiense]|uniref:Aldehyde dehydrogenase n=1 Tax=Novosphingobium malaysiense TaxID=1348853 RepID=A0A0B1ZIM5_9SPHN|nr:aldehyde dehydrogenase family protein [Novosphingobium malaysiense]KHK90387.1 aldehyde dehydrogenase [Novosphingobium malaysiense]